MDSPTIFLVLVDIQKFDFLQKSMFNIFNDYPYLSLTCFENNVYI